MESQARLKAMLSLAVGLTTSAAKLPGLCKAASSLKGHDEGYKYALYPLLFVPVVLIMGVVAKIYFAFTCASHMWNLTSGCVEMA